MNIAQDIRVILVKRDNMSEAELARKLDNTSQNLNQKMQKNNFKLSDLESIADSLGCTLEINFIDKLSGRKMN